MSTKEYAYQKATHKGLLELIVWSQNSLCLRDWTVTLDTGSKIPRELMPGKASDFEGLACITADALRALIWIPLDRLVADNSNPIEACIHELIHISNTARGIDDDELLTRIIAPLIYKLYCHEHKIKIAKEKSPA